MVHAVQRIVKENWHCDWTGCFSLASGIPGERGDTEMKSKKEIEHLGQEGRPEGQDHWLGRSTNRNSVSVAL